MCGRYSLFAPPEVVEERFDATFCEEFQPRYNAAPRQSLPVIGDDHDGEIRTMEWGLVPPWADSRDEGSFINARAETVADKPSFRDAFRREEPGGRCLVLADGFYEWVEEDGGKQPYRVTLEGERPFAMAGLWTPFQPATEQTGLGEFGAGGDGSSDPGAGGPDPVETFTIVTTEPNATVADLHHRMAVVLPEGREREWLTAPPGEAVDCLEPYEGEMRAYPVPEAVNDPSNDSPAVAEPLSE
jgi:putative SOS response-associated peptidase YedK